MGYVVQRDAAIYDITTEEVGALSRDFGIVGPERVAGSGVKREHNAPGPIGIENAVVDDARSFEAVRSAEFLAPEEPESRNGLLVDLV